MIRWNRKLCIPNATEKIQRYRFRLYPCIKTFNANVTIGRIQEKVVDESGDIFSFTSLGFKAAVDLDCVKNTSQWQILKWLGYEFSNSTRWLTYNTSRAEGTMDEPVYASSAINPCANNVTSGIITDLGNGTDLSQKALEAVPAQSNFYNRMVTTSGLEDNLFWMMLTGEVRNSWAYGHPRWEGAEALMAIYDAGSDNGTL